jgi:hypothetical protein
MTVVLTSEYALIEFAAPRDPMSSRIDGGSEALYSNSIIAGFDAAFASQLRASELTRN